MAEKGKVKHYKKTDKRTGKVRASWIKRHLILFYEAQDRGEPYYMWGKEIKKPEDIDGYEEYAARLNDPKTRLKREYNARYRAKVKAESREAKDNAMARALGIGGGFDLELRRKEEERRKAVQSVVEEYRAIMDSEEYSFEVKAAKEYDLVYNNPEIFSLIFKSSFIHFIAFFHKYIYGKEFIFEKHHLKICEALSRRVLATDRLEKPHLMINMPPRAGKSQIVKYFCAWGYAHNGKSNYISTACDERLAQRTGDEVKTIVSSEIFGRLFGVGINRANKSREYWETSLGGRFRASPLRGGIVGFDAGVLEDEWGGCVIIDDMLKPVDALSEAANEEVWEIYTDTIKSRRNNKSGKFRTPIILISQRLSVMDLCARIKNSPEEAEEFEILEVPALVNEKSYWEYQISTKELLKMREANPYLFWSQYMQDPIVAGGNFIKSDWFPYFSYRDLPVMRRVFLCADTAYTTGKFSDYTAVGLMGVSADWRLYFLDLLHMKEEAETVKERLSQFWRKYRENQFWRGARLSCIVIEKRGTGISLIQDLKRAGAPVREIVSPHNKGQRAIECAEYFRNGYVLLPESNKNAISEKFLKEAATFSEENKSRAIHDDILDMVMYAVQFGLMTKRGLF